MTITPLPTEFIVARRRQRIAEGFATALDTRPYADIHIEDITCAAGVGRKTLYDTFAGKDAIAGYLLGSVSPGLAGHIGGGVEQSALGLLLVELAAAHRRGEAQEAASKAQGVSSLLQYQARKVSPQSATDGDPLACTLPPGRHGLPREFVTANQRHRLYVGLAEAIAENGYAGTTIAHITRHAAVSRRTFYEHFPDKTTAAHMFLEDRAGIGEPVDPRYGFDAALIEVAAAAYIYGPVKAMAMASEAAAALATFCSSLDKERAHAA